MKIQFTLIISLLISQSIFAQQGINYKAILKDSNGNVLASTFMNVQFTIHQNSATGTIVYQEDHNYTTDANGLLILNIGTDESPLVGTFSSIDWSAEIHFLQVTITYSGGTINFDATEFMAVPYAKHAKTAENVFSGDYNDLINKPTLNTYAIGDFTQGGIVFWVDATGQHGLVCAKSDQSSGVRWYAGTNGNTQAKGDGIYAGKTNTAIIISSQVSIGDDNSTYAARICNELQVTESGIVYGDWYLPSKYELNQMYINRAIINATSTANGGTNFGTNYYWSSTESNSNAAWEQYFLNGNQFPTTKSLNDDSVRAIRAF